MKGSGKLLRGISIWLFAGLLSNMCHGQQQIQFTQYMFNNLILNPAYAGADEGISLTFINRSQWAGIENASRTQTMAGHSLSDNKRMGIGFTLQNDRVGVQKNMNGSLAYAYHLKTGRHSVLSMGIQGGFRNSKRDYTSLVGSATDPLVDNLFINTTSFDFGSGFYFRSKDFRAGISAPSMIPERFQLNDTVRLSLWARNVFGFFSYVLKINDNVDIMPSTLIKYSPTLPFGFDANVNLIYRKILTMGLSFRHNESIDFLLKAKITNTLQIGYAYDQPYGVANRISNGSNEIMVNYLFKPDPKKYYRPRR
jgi:type IX secretion system PorP/SprF family membrane protein